MGLFDFVKDAGEKIWNTVTNHDDAATKIQDHLKKLGIPDADKVKVKVDGDKATVSGEGLSQELKEKILVAVGNVAGISNVDDQIKTTATNDANTNSQDGRFYQVKSGDTLSTIAKQMYGDASKYGKIFEANKPMLTSPDKIYPGQTLRIPA